MFIRKTMTRTMKDGTTYHAFRLVHNVRYGAKVKQETLLHLGSQFPVKESDWPLLCRRIDERLQGQVSLLPPLPKPLEGRAEVIVGQLFAKQAERLRQAKLPRASHGIRVGIRWM